MPKLACPAGVSSIHVVATRHLSFAPPGEKEGVCSICLPVTVCPGASSSAILQETYQRTAIDILSSVDGRAHQLGTRVFGKLKLYEKRALPVRTALAAALCV